MLDNPYVRLANNWLHDVATGLWAACLLVLYVLNSRAAELAADPALAPAIEALSGAAWAVFLLLIIALVAVTLTGVARLLYWRAETAADELATKRKALIGKHIAFIAVYGPGSALAYWLYAGISV